MKIVQRYRRMREYQRLAMLLNDLPVDPAAEPGYDVLADGLVWMDEAPFDHPADEWLEIRVLWHHRTRLILGEPSKYGSLWDLGLKRFPNWPGFLPERRAPLDWYKTLLAAERAGRDAWCRENGDKPPWEWPGVRA